MYVLQGVVTKYTPIPRVLRRAVDCPNPRKLWDRVDSEACHCNPKWLDISRKKWYYYVCLKKVRGGVMGFGDTLV